MSSQARFEHIEFRQDTLEHTFVENNKILEATHGVVSLILNDQREMRKDQLEFKRDICSLINQLEKKVDNRIDGLGSRIDQLELLIRQHFTQS